MKILAFEHLRDRVLGRETDEIIGGKFRKPAPVEIDHRLFRIKNLEDLGFVGFGVLFDLLARKRRTRSRSPCRIADHSGEIADKENDRVTQVLKVFQLAKDHCVPRCRSGAVGSMPSFTRSGLPVARDFSSLERSSPSRMISALPFFI